MVKSSLYKIVFYNALIFFVIFLSLFILLVHGWIHNNFGKIDLELILFTVMLPLKGTPGGVIFSFIKNLVCPVFMYSCFLMVMFNVILDMRYFNGIIIKKIYAFVCCVQKKLLLLEAIKIFIIFFICCLISIQIVNFILPIRNNKFYNSNKSKIYKSSLISHACGQIEGKNYTNSLEALIQSIKNGYKFIEVDLCITDDKNLVAMHDFEHFKQITKTKGINNTLEEIKHLKIYGKYTPLLVSDINRIFTENKDLILVTDKIQDFDILLNNFKFTDRMIVEVFSYEKYKEAQKKGIKYPALCVCDTERIRQVIKYNIKMITTEISFFKQNIKMFKYLHKKGVVVMVFGTPTINDEIFLKNNLGNDCSLAYVDNILPKENTNK